MPIITGGNIISSGGGGVIPFAGVPGVGTDAIQTVTIGGTPEVASTFRLSFDGWRTAKITWSGTNATLVANILAALVALPNIGAAGVAVAVGTMTAGVGTITVTFSGATVAKKAVPAIGTLPFLKSDGTASAGTVAVAITTPGVTADLRDANKGQLVTDTTNGIVYVNTGVPGAPTWTKVGAQT